MNFQEINKGDKVFDINHGHGIVTNIYVYKFQTKKVSVKFTSGGIFEYDETGRLYVHQFTPTISRNEYKATPISDYYVGQEVFDINYGWGKVTEVATAKKNKTPIRVLFDEHNVGYSREGKRFERQYATSLSETEYPINYGFLYNLLHPTHMEAPIDETGKNPEPVTPKTFGNPAPTSYEKSSRREKLLDSVIAITIGAIFLAIWYVIFK